MYSPFLLDVALKHSSAELDNIRTQLLEIIEGKYEFSKIEITPESIDFKDNFPFQKVRITNDQIKVSYVIENGDSNIERMKDLFQLLYKVLKCKYFSIEKLELVFIMKLKDPKKLVNLSLESEDIDLLDLKCSLSNNTSLRFMVNKTAGKFGSINLNSTAVEIPTAEVSEKIDESYELLIHTFNRIVSNREEILTFVDFSEEVANE